MSQAESKNPILDGNDILFECGQCGKSLAIDCRGAGLNIRCPHCDSELEVPIPEGFDLAELDKVISESAGSDEDIKKTAPDAAAAALSGAAEQINLLKAELKTVRAQQQNSTLPNADVFKAAKAVHSQIDELRKSLDKLDELLNALPDGKAGDLHTDETQKIG